jgi:hypothetical protein
MFAGTLEHITSEIGTKWRLSMLITEFPFIITIPPLFCTYLCLPMRTVTLPGRTLSQARCFKLEGGGGLRLSASTWLFAE